jgi:hypothetical protein
MEYLAMEMLKFIGGVLFFIYGLPILLSAMCDLSSWISGDKKQDDQDNYYANILDESKAFMYKRR